MIEVRIIDDDVPTYILSDSPFAKGIMVPVDFVQKYHCIMEDFNGLQEELGLYYEGKK
jgi:hypothetical protein